MPKRAGKAFQANRTTSREAQTYAVFRELLVV